METIETRKVSYLETKSYKALNGKKGIPYIPNQLVISNVR